MSEQPLPTEGKQDVTEALIALLRQRQAKGIATYGRSLETFNGRSMERDALEEAIDLAQYEMGAQLERAELERQLAELRAKLAKAAAVARELLNACAGTEGDESIELATQLDDLLAPEAPAAFNKAAPEDSVLKAEAKAQVCAGCGADYHPDGESFCERCGGTDLKPKSQAPAEDAIRQAVEVERERVLGGVWYELKAALPVGEPQRILNSVIDAIRARGGKS